MGLHWEYKMLQHNGDLTLDELNDLGSQGWELCAHEPIVRNEGTLLPVRTGYYLIFKRAIFAHPAVTAQEDAPKEKQGNQMSAENRTKAAERMRALHERRRVKSRTERIVEAGGGYVPVVGGTVLEDAPQEAARSDEPTWNDAIRKLHDGEELTREAETQEATAD